MSPGANKIRGSEEVGDYWNLLHTSSCEMVTFCDILHEAKQKSKNKLSRVRSTDWKSPLREYFLSFDSTSLFKGVATKE